MSAYNNAVEGEINFNISMLKWPMSITKLINLWIKKKNVIQSLTTHITELIVDDSKVTSVTALIST